MGGESENALFYSEAPPKPEFDFSRAPTSSHSVPTKSPDFPSLRNYISPLAKGWPPSGGRDGPSGRPPSNSAIPNYRFVTLPAFSLLDLYVILISNCVSFRSPLFSSNVVITTPEDRLARSPYMSLKRPESSPPPMQVNVLQQVEDSFAYEAILNERAPKPAHMLLREQEERYHLQQQQDQPNKQHPRPLTRSLVDPDELGLSTQQKDEDSDSVEILAGPFNDPTRKRVAADAARNARIRLQLRGGVEVDDEDYEFQLETRALMEDIAAKKAALVAKFPAYLTAEDMGLLDRSRHVDGDAPSGGVEYVSVSQARVEAEVSRKESRDLLRARAAAVAKEREHEAADYRAKLEDEQRLALRNALSERRRVSVFTPEENEQMEASIRGGDRVVLTNFSIDIKTEDLKRLRPGQWLNDEVINYRPFDCRSHCPRRILPLETEMELMNERARQTGVKIHCFSSIFYAFLSEKGFSYNRVQRWTRRIDVFSLDRVIIPIHLGSHWCLAVINFKAKKFEYYDSLGSPNQKCLERLRRWVEEESLDKKKVPYDVR